MKIICTKSNLVKGVGIVSKAVPSKTTMPILECILINASENGIKFTVLSPYQAQKIRKEGEDNWQDVSWGNIDPARSYRYYIKSAPGKFIDLFFYDGAISKSVAFDELLKDGNKHE